MQQLEHMYRIMILFMLECVEFPLTNTQITNFILDRDYTDFFTIQEALSELQSSQLITPESTHSNTRYHITEEGRKTLTLMGDKLSIPIKNDILSYFREHNYDLKQEASVYANYYRDTPDGYQVVCRVVNGSSTVMELSLHTATKEQAKAICVNWNTQCTEVYALLMDQLLK